MRLLVSIHDVMPATLDRTLAIFERLQTNRLMPVTLLVVPGSGWDARGIDVLKTMVAEGAELAGHGWRHEVRRIRGVRHWLHSRLISRRAAEHLALSRAGVLRLMLRNRAWFGRHGLPAPALYVPPAWAMGPIPHSLLDRLPFDFHETLSGVYDARRKQFHRLPMAGFETDTALRASFVAGFNSLNRTWARSGGRPLRLGIHPFDFDLRLADSLKGWIDEGGRALGYSGLRTVSAGVSA
ncbi:MAG: polysaccharide deacetylase family protein [Wenzhouxiangella sp.]|jgi:predicted deacetylase|nr:polysaccharide deacetylase family protein [Wenzhouxiangella sp.]